MSDIIVTIPHDIAFAANIDEPTARIELATALYRDGKLSMGKARKFANLEYSAFLEALAQRDIPLNYSVEDALQDTKTIEALLK